MTDDRETARQIITSAAANHLGWEVQMSMIENALRQVRDQVTAETEQRVRRETLEWVMERMPQYQGENGVTTEKYKSFISVLWEEFRRAAESQPTESPRHA